MKLGLRLFKRRTPALVDLTAAQEYALSCQLGALIYNDSPASLQDAVRSSHCTAPRPSEPHKEAASFKI
jgi:hypothetical protein